MNLITKNYNGIEIDFSINIATELYLNATKIAKHFKKLPADWLRLKETKDYIKAILKTHKNNPPEVINSHNTNINERKNNFLNGDLVIKSRYNYIYK